MKRAEQTYKEEGLQVIWMGFQDKKERLKDFMIKHDIQSSVGFDVRDAIAGQYGIAYGAGLIAINTEGIVTQRIPKGFSEKGLVEALEHVIQETEERKSKSPEERRSEVRKNGRMEGNEQMERSADTVNNN